MLERLYYDFYQILKTQRKNDQSYFNAFIGLSFLIYLNIASVFGIINYFIRYKVSRDVSVISSIIVFGLVLLFNVFKLWNKKKQITLKYDLLTANQKNYRWPIWLFIVVSFLLFYHVLEYLV